MVLIPTFWICDGKNDCPLGTDEVECTCGDYNMIEGKTASNNTVCLPATTTVFDDEMISSATQEEHETSEGLQSLHMCVQKD